MNSPSQSLTPALLVAIFLLAACSGPERLSLARIYEHRATVEKTPVIVIPGFMGSRLEDVRTGREIWPGSIFDLVTGLSDTPKRLVADLDRPAHLDNTRPSGLFFEALGEDYYATLVDTLIDAGGYECQPADRIEVTTDCALLAWDWRRRPEEAVDALASTVERFRSVKGDRNLKVDVVAHSAGGLIARAYLQALYTDPPGEKPDTVRKLILLGVPNLGSIHGLQTALRGRQIGLKTVPTETIIQFPGVFILLPHPARNWMIDMKGNRVQRELFDIQTWRRWEFSIFQPSVRARIIAAAGSKQEGIARLAELEGILERHLDAARLFIEALGRSADPLMAEVITIGGGCHKTPARCAVEEIGGREIVRLTPDEIAAPKASVDYDRLMTEPGDGLVTRASVIGRDVLSPQLLTTFDPGVVRFLCVPHSQIASDPTFRDNLLNILLE